MGKETYTGDDEREFRLRLRFVFEAFDSVLEVLYPRWERGRGLFQKRESEFVVLKGFLRKRCGILIDL